MEGARVNEPLSNGQVVWRLQQMERKVETLELEVDKRFDTLNRKVDRLTLTIAGGAVTFAISVAVFAFTILATGSG
jgi:hypothetical protein